MAGGSQDDPDDAITGINVTPLVDITLVLLIIFMVTAKIIVSQSVPHLHAHVVPRTKGDGLKGFFWPRAKYADDAERDDFAAKIAAAL